MRLKTTLCAFLARILRQSFGSGWFDLVVAAGRMPTTATNYELLVNTTTF